MDRQVAELLQWLQSDSRGPEALQEVVGLVSALQTRRILDPATTGQILALLEPWALAAELPVRVDALQLGIALAEGGEAATLCRLLRHAGQTELAQSGDKGAAIALFEEALEADVNIDLMLELAKLYEARGDEGDGSQAADLYTALGDFLGKEGGADFLNTALDLVPGHTDALDTLEQLIAPDKHGAELGERWRAYIEASTDEDGIAKRHLSIARQHAADGDYAEALLTIKPLVEAGNQDALALRDDFLDAARRDREVETALDADPPTDLFEPKTDDDTSRFVTEAAANSEPPPAPESTPPPQPEAAPEPQPAETPPQPAYTSDVAPRRPTFPWGWVVAGMVLIGCAIGAAFWITSSGVGEPGTVVALDAPAPTANPPAAAAPAPSAGTGTEVEAGTEAEAETGTETGTETEAEAETETETETEAEAETGTEAEAEAETETETETEAAPAPAASVRTDISVRAATEHGRLRGGKLDRDQLASALQAIVPQLERCYDDALARRPKLRGRLVLQWNIRRSGAVSGLRKVRSSLQDARLHRCAKEVVAAASYPKPKRPVLVRMPFDFVRPRKRK